MLNAAISRVSSNTEARSYEINQRIRSALANIADELTIDRIAAELRAYDVAMRDELQSLSTVVDIAFDALLPAVTNSKLGDLNTASRRSRQGSDPAQVA